VPDMTTGEFVVGFWGDMLIVISVEVITRVAESLG
jgi:hypothetical protein